MKTTYQIKEELTLILMYLNHRCMHEEFFDKHIIYTFKGYDFGDINSLTKEDYIIQSNIRKSSMVFITDKGIRKAKELLKEWNIEE